jgi:hypothetical protein
MEYFKGLPDPPDTLFTVLIVFSKMALKSISLCLISTALAAPSPQGVHGSAGHENAPLGIGNMADMLANSFKGPVAPLPLYKVTNAEKPEFTVPGVIREQLYYGPLVLKPAAVRSSRADARRSFKSYNEYRRKPKKKRVRTKWIPVETSLPIELSTSRET